MADSNKPFVVELSIEFVVELLLFLYPYGAEQMNLPHNFFLGLGCWISGAAIAIRMFWIFPVWTHRLTRLEKGLISFIVLGLFVAGFYKPVVKAYGKRNVGAIESWNTPSRANSQPSPPIASHAASDTKSTATTQTETKKARKPSEITTQENHGGSNNTNTQVGTAQAPTAIAPNGIANAAPNYGNQTVNAAPPDRHLSPEQRAAIISAIQGKSCRITTVGALSNVEDAQNYALELMDAFKSGGCLVPDNVLPLMSLKGTWRGIKVIYYDDVPHSEGSRVSVPLDTPQGIVVAALDSARLDVMVGGDSNTPKDTVQLAVGGRSK